MTVLNMVENIRRRHGWIQEAEALKRIGVAQREFAGDTHCLLQELDITPETSPFADRYLLSEDTVSHVRSVKFLDAAEVEQDKETLDLDYYIDGRYLYITDWDGNQITSYPADLALIRVNAIHLPLTDIAINETLDVEERFHKAILAKVYEDLYAETGNAQMAMYYRGVYKDAVREGKKYANMDGSYLHPGVVNNDIL